MWYQSEIETIWPTRKKDPNDTAMTLKEINDMPIEQIIHLDNFFSLESIEADGNRGAAWKVALVAEKLKDADGYTLFDRVFPHRLCIIFIWKKEPEKLIHTLN